MVDTGAGQNVQVVCGAPNARTGLVSVFAPPGTHIPGKDITLGVGTIRGVESRGMLCSAAELQLSEDHDGIIELPADAPVGTAYADYARLGDPVIEINLTPNRQDCTGVHGIARDLAAADMGTLKPDAIKPVKGEFKLPVAVKVEAPDLCPGFALRLVRGVKNGPSPQWLQQRLSAIGLRPINALVDITNYITFDRARPLHVFDAKKVHGDLVVRRARDGETLLALDGRTYTLDPSMCVIADDNGVESLAGIMGGEASGCDESTTDVLIESALWNELNIAQTGRKLGINTDARYRFERGVDPAFMLPGLDLATRMVMELCGGEPSEAVCVGQPYADDRLIEFPLSETKRLAGIDVPLIEARRILTRLGFMVAGNGPMVKVAVPSWRSDVHGKADLVEEIVRIIGVDKVPLTPFDRGSAPRKPVLTPLQRRTSTVRRALATRGMVEAVTWSFIAKGAAEAFGGGDAALALANPIASDLSDMRPSLLPGLLMAAQANADRGTPDIALFEVGQVFRGTRPQDQFMAAAGVRRGLSSAIGRGRHWSDPASEPELRANERRVLEAKADAFAVLSAAGAPMQALQIASGDKAKLPDWLHPGRSGAIQIGPQNVLGYFGELHPRALAALGIDGPVVGFEVILNRLPEPKQRATRAKPALVVSPLQPVTRDFAFIVDETVGAADVVRAAQAADKKLTTDVTVFDVYQSSGRYEAKGVPAGKKSLAIAVTLQPRDKTMTDAEIDAVAAAIVAEVTKKTGGTLRG
jgi:phenylalanyl-tRNA synthetase beta chain